MAVQVVFFPPLMLNSAGSLSEAVLSSTCFTVPLLHCTEIVTSLVLSSVKSLWTTKGIMISFTGIGTDSAPFVSRTWS
ncbi:hypothetical protein HRbin25_00314 [bacterium HR25]|nr:hypothetical protein HRbin25_00314 [bacterium HR25]